METRTPVSPYPNSECPIHCICTVYIMLAKKKVWNNVSIPNNCSTVFVVPVTSSFRVFFGE